MCGAIGPAVAGAAAASSAGELAGGVPVWITAMIVFCLAFLAWAVHSVIREVLRVETDLQPETGRRVARLSLVSGMPSVPNRRSSGRNPQDGP